MSQLHLHRTNLSYYMLSVPHHRRPACTCAMSSEPTLLCTRPSRRYQVGRTLNQSCSPLRSALSASGCHRSIIFKMCASVNAEGTVLRRRQGGCCGHLPQHLLDRAEEGRPPLRPRAVSNPPLALLFPQSHLTLSHASHKQTPAEHISTECKRQEKSALPFIGACHCGILETDQWHAGSRAAVGIGNRIWGNETVMTFLKTGVFNYWVPLGGVIHWEVLPLSSLALPQILPDFDRALP